LETGNGTQANQNEQGPKKSVRKRASEQANQNSELGEGERNKKGGNRRKREEEK